MKQRILVDFDIGSRSVPDMPFEAALCAIARVSTKRALPSLQLRVEIDVCGIPNAIGDD